MRGTFRALRYRNYRLFFGGQTLSLIGTWMQSVAMSWLVYRLTGSEVLLGTVAFASQIPMFVLSPFAGVYTDLLDRRRLLIITQTLSMLQAGTLAALVLTGAIQVWHIVVLSVVVGAINAFDTPGRQAFVPELIEDRADLPNAIALNSTQFNLARLVGPPLAGFLIRLAGEGVCFLVNTISFLAVVGALVAMRVPPHLPHPRRESAYRQFRAGASYAWGLRTIRSLLALMAVVSLVSGVYQVLLPVYAKEVFRGDSGTLGFLYGAVGLGALVAAVMLASRRSVVGLGRWIVIASATFALGMAAFGLTRNPWTGMFALLFLGFGIMKHMGSTNTLIQTVVDDDMRGRVMAFYAMSFVGTMPLGSLLGGIVSAQVGPIYTLLGASCLSLVATFVFWRSLPVLRRELGPIYREKGILPGRGAR